MTNAAEPDSVPLNTPPPMDELHPASSDAWDEVIEESFPASDPPPEPTILSDRLPVPPSPPHDYHES